MNTEGRGGGGAAVAAISIIETAVALSAPAEIAESTLVSTNCITFKTTSKQPATSASSLVTADETTGTKAAASASLTNVKIPLPLTSSSSSSSNKFQQSHKQPAASKTINRSSSKNAPQTGNQPTSSPSGSNPSNSNSGHTVTARLMDMGKRLLDAAREGQTDHVRQLVVNSGAPFTSDWLGTTALHLAAQNGHLEIAEILLRGGVNRDARTKLERTALHLAAQGGWLELVDLLLLHGSDANARDMLRMTPLHWAVERGHIRVAERLLFHGADLTARSKFRLTPIDIAHNSESYAMLELLKSWTKKNENLRIFSDLASSFCESHDNMLLDNMDFQLPAHHHHHSESTMKQTLSSCSSNTIDDNTKTNCQPYNNNSNNINNNPSNISNIKQQELNMQRATILDISEPCIDLVELEWNALRLKPDFFLSNDTESNLIDDDEDEDDEDEDDEDEPKVEYLMKVVEELQKENRQLRQRVEQLSTTIQ